MADPGRLHRLITNPTTLHAFCAYLANGGSPIEWCEEQGVAWSDVHWWVQADPVRRQLYESAMDARNEWAIQRILQELRTLGLADVKLLFDSQGNVRPLEEIPASARLAIAGIEIEELYGGRGENREPLGRLKKVKLYDKLRALELLGKHLKMFIDRLEVSGGLKLEDLFVKSMASALPIPLESTKPPIESSNDRSNIGG